MATQKRRVVYFSDEDWTEAEAQAKRLDMSISAYLRSLVVGGAVVPASVRQEMRRIETDLAARSPMFTNAIAGPQTGRGVRFTPAPKPSQKERATRS